MEYYLAYIRTCGREDGYYLLVKADSIEEARKKVKADVANNNKIIDIIETLK